MRFHVREVLLSEGADDLMAHLVASAAAAGDAPIAMVTVDAGPTILFRSRLGLPDALELSGGASAAGWPLRFASASDPAIVSSKGLGLTADPGSAASMLGDFSAVAVPTHFDGEVTGALAVIDPHPRSFSPDTAFRLRELWERAQRFLIERARCASILELRDPPMDDRRAGAAIRASVHEVRSAYHRMRVSATLARWHVAGRLPRTEEFCRVVEEALLAAAELSRNIGELIRWSRLLRKDQPGAPEFLAAVVQAARVEPAFRPGLRVVQAARASVRDPALWISALSALPMAAELEPWGTSTMSSLILASERLPKVRTSPPAA